MTEQHRIPEASPNTFDGDAISRRDREFLASLGDHPLTRNPLYGAPCPPPPDFSKLKPEEIEEATREAVFATAVNWMLANYAYYQHAFMGRGGVIALGNGAISSIAALRGLLQPCALVTEGPRGGIKTTSVVDVWMMHRERIQIDAVQIRSDQPRPTFTENDYVIFNRYRPPVHPAAGGSIAAFETFFARLIPDAAERGWLWHWLAHKARRPWVPMVGVMMVAEEFGTGRGTLFDILELLFGKDYVVPCTFSELTGTSAAARFNARLADALVAVVNEAVAEDGEQQAQRRLNYEALKNSIDPSPTARQRFEAKGQHAYAQASARSTIIATNHRDVVKLPRDDRRIEVLTCGRKMTAAETAEIRAWMADPENIGALQRALLATAAVPTDVFDPFGQPPPFAGRQEMIGMGKSRLEDSYEAAIDALEGCPLFTMTQMQRLIACIGAYTGGDGSDRTRHTVAKNAYRLRERDEADNRIRYRKRQEVIYARTRAEQRRWHKADTRVIIAALDRAEERVMQVVNAEHDPLADLAHRQRPEAPLVMPALPVVEVAGEAEPPVAEQLINSNALRQRRYRERQALRRIGQALRVESAGDDDDESLDDAGGVTEA
jgi:hypothetical protein